MCYLLVEGREERVFKDNVDLPLLKRNLKNRRARRVENGTCRQVVLIRRFLDSNAEYDSSNHILR